MAIFAQYPISQAKTSAQDLASPSLLAIMRKKSSSKNNWGQKEIIELFIERIEELRATRLVSSGFNIPSRIHWDHKNGLRIDLPPIALDDLRSFLTIFRHFISEQEPVYISRVLNLCQQFLGDDDSKAGLIEARKYWKKSLEQNGLGFQLNHKDLKPEEIMGIWINGWSHHNDPEYRRLLMSLSPPTRDFFHIFFLDALVESTKVILVTGDLIASAFERNLFSFES